MLVCQRIRHEPTDGNTRCATGRTTGRGDFRAPTPAGSDFDRSNMIRKALRAALRRLRGEGEATTGPPAGGETDTGRRTGSEASGEDAPERRPRERTGQSSDRDEDDEGGTRTRSDIIAETGMTPSEFVRTLLQENGGRAYQGTVCDETGLSKSATSRLLTQMEEEGQVTRLSIGREKVVCLPDHEPEIAESPDVEEVPSGA